MKEFSKYEEVVPKLYPESGANQTTSEVIQLIKNYELIYFFKLMDLRLSPKNWWHYLQSEELYENHLKIELNLSNKSFTLDLMRNTHLIPSHYFEKHHHNGNYVNSKPHLKVNIDIFLIYIKI